jgi:uncharacterized membrane protein YphA (DoxX/SURF4 family)
LDVHQSYVVLVPPAAELAGVPDAVDEDLDVRPVGGRIDVHGLERRWVSTCRVRLPRMKPSGWLFLAGACMVVLGLFAWWPALLVVPFLSFGAFKQSETEKKAADQAAFEERRRRNWT